MAKTHVIAATCGEKPGFMLLIELEDLMDRPLDGTINAVRAAVREWAGTYEGIRFTRGTAGTIDWGDFVNEVPTHTCGKHGFSIRSTILSERVVVHDENLLAD